MKVFGFVKKVLFIGLTILSNFTNVSSLSWISMSKQPCKARPEIVIVNSNEPVFHPFSIKTNKILAIVIILMIHIQKFAYLILQKILKFSI